MSVYLSKPFILHRAITLPKGILGSTFSWLRGRREHFPSSPFVTPLLLEIELKVGWRGGKSPHLFQITFYKEAVLNLGFWK